MARGVQGEFHVTFYVPCVIPSLLSFRTYSRALVRSACQVQPLDPVTYSLKPIRVRRGALTGGTAVR
eukprot:33435-Eustigmatos_ZCMA.PRE.1